MAATPGGGGDDDEPLPPLAVPTEGVSGGTADPFWRQLLVHLESGDQEGSGGGSGGDGSALSFLPAFQPEALPGLVSAMPASILTALVAGVAAVGTSPASRTTYLRCLEAAARALTTEAWQRGSADNATAVVVRLGSGPKKTGQPAAA